MAKYAILKTERAEGTGGTNAVLDSFYSHLIVYGPSPEQAIRNLLAHPAMQEVYRPYCQKVLERLNDWTYSYTDVALGIRFSTMTP